MKRESMNVLSIQTVVLRATNLVSEEEKHALFQKQQQLIQENQKQIEELRQTLTITHLLLGKSSALSWKWKQCKEKCK